MSEPDQKTKFPRLSPLALVGIFLLVALIVAGAYFLTDWFNYYRQYRGYAAGPQEISEPVIEHEAIVVLTGTQRRIPRAIELLRRRGSPLLIISGTGKGTTLTDLVNTQGDAAVNIHEVWQKIILEPKSTSTIENAEETAKLVRSRNIERLVLVTSDYHMPRSLLIFHRFLPGIEIIPYPVRSASPSSNGAPESYAKVVLEYMKYFVLAHFIMDGPT
jgi:uncharacterized SAM-binding protein YcdF (DUF218 family)